MLPIGRKSRYNPEILAQCCLIVFKCHIKFAKNVFNFNGFYNGFCKQHVFCNFEKHAVYKNGYKTRWNKDILPVAYRDNSVLLL